MTHKHRLDCILVVAVFLGGCASNSPRSRQNAGAESTSNRNAPLQAPASPGSLPSFGVPTGFTATSGHPLPNGGKGYQLVYNPFSGHWTYARPDASPKYNTMEDRWEIARDSDELRYNALEDNWQYVPRNAETKYNPMEDRFQFANPQDELKYNSMEDKWQYAPAKSSLRYNAMDDKWQYVPDE